VSHQSYSVRSVHESLLRTFHQYLRAQYHIWDEALIDERDRLIEKVGSTYQEPRLEATPQYASGRPYADLEVPNAVRAVLAKASDIPSSGIPKVAYTHQCQAVEGFVGRRRDLIVATGTGSGKTESFLMPILGNLAIEASDRANSWLLPGMRALLLYPMNALVNDQLARLRRLFGNPELSSAISPTRQAVFGMYTGRTPYPGQRTKTKDNERVVSEIRKLYFDGMTDEFRERLHKEGKWPAKDLDMFLANGLKTIHGDAELLTRHEMQASCPDLLVTNYSMLEYMMLRPLEASIFEQTAKWLDASADNVLTVVLDEAHMYRGSGGAEVAYLLRRLQSRLAVSREKIRYILTSASLGTTEEALLEIKRFAARLTGGHEDIFELVRSEREARPAGAQATESQQRHIAAFDHASILGVIEPERARGQLQTLGMALGVSIEAETSSIDHLRNCANELLDRLPVAHLVAEQLTRTPTTLAQVAEIAFPVMAKREEAAEALLALMAFARDDKRGRPFCPIRSHLFFRGLPGLYVCTNTRCTFRANQLATPLGKLHPNERLSCECGARVYELLTHRACGAAFLRAFMQESTRDFLWHAASNGTWSNEKLAEAQFYVVPAADVDTISGDLVWLHVKTGQLISEKPAGSAEGEFLPLLFPGRQTRDNGQSILSDHCPACLQALRNDAPIAMDLATKGEAPFAHIVRAQVATQPLSAAPSPGAPNGGRKTLIFSDGRQKAARLARDIPREIELDVFRQALFIAARELSDIDKEPRLDNRLYVGFLKCLLDSNLRFFDGADRDKLENHLRDFEVGHQAQLESILDEMPKAPPSYSALLLKQLGTPFYSISALSLGYAAPGKTANSVLRRVASALSPEDANAWAVVWIQRLLSRYSFDMELGDGVRRKASRYPHRPTQAIDGFSKIQQDLLASKGIDAKQLAAAFANAMGQLKADGSVYVNPLRVVLKSALKDRWVQCEECRTVSPLLVMGQCPNCRNPNAPFVDPGNTSYLRARKGFWRDPVVNAVNGSEGPMNLDVQEHSAQLSYKDSDSPAPTTEIFERRFRDLLRPGERAVDVLSCTTTMEVGIDIGSLIAVAMRNVPPMRQNYQQRAGRAGRRGASISTVLTYAQAGAHDAFYFANPDKIIAGDPPKPVLDTSNERIASRHVHAQMLQDFFRPLAQGRGASDIFTALGDTWSFYNEVGPASLAAFTAWVSSKVGKESIARAQDWLPDGLSAQICADAFVNELNRIAPKTPDGLETSLLEFLFAHGMLPSYAFPRDLVALQIQEATGGSDFRVVEQAQQGMGVALSEYAPGRLVVVNKKTYRIGTVASSGVDTELNRSESLFDRAETYQHCTQCTYSAGFIKDGQSQTTCPQCGNDALRTVPSIRPEVVYPRGRREIDEFDDDQVFSRVSQAQLPLTEAERRIAGTKFGKRGELASTRSQNLIVVNEGDPGSNEYGFRVCTKCGKTLLEGEPESAHTLDYYVKVFRGLAPSKCNGEFQRVFLGYKFPSDILLLRLSLAAPLRFGVANIRTRKPLEDALQTLCDGLTLAIARVLDVDSREVSAGFRFGNDGKTEFADIFIYDTLAGGAGYALEAGKNFEAIFGEMVRIFDSCTCSASCENCLRHYGNRFHHADLDRFLGLDLAHYILDGTVPPEFDPAQQRHVLEPLLNMLKLAGWDILETDKEIQARHQTHAFALSACPSLRACDPWVRDAGTQRLTFTPYELARDLPSAFAELK
jgi:ATP-dependent helicase YprA (DUF1998 family)/Zn finger protein HypA/HybF involved in hydrogenase expression